MKENENNVEELAQVIAAGDAWLRQYGVLSAIHHNAIVANLYVRFPKVRYLEYFLPPHGSSRKVWIRLYVPFWKLLFLRRDRMMDEVIDFLREYLSDYDIQVELKRYKKGVEKSNEVPKIAMEHLAPSSELQPSPVPATPQPAAEASSASGDDPKGSEGPRSEPGAGEPVLPSSEPGEPKSSV